MSSALLFPAVLALAVTSGCANDVELVGACVPDGEAVRVLESPRGVSIGVLDGRVLLAWSVPTARTSVDGTREAELRAGWVIEDAVVGPMLIGWTRDYGPRSLWVRHENELVTHAVITTSEVEPLSIWAEDAVALVHFSEDGSSRVEPVALTLGGSRPRPGSFCEWCSRISYGGSQMPAGPDAALPILGTPAGPLGAVMGVPRGDFPHGCVTIDASNDEPMLFGAINATPYTRPRCAEPANEWPHTPALVRREAGAGLLYRVGDSIGQGVVHYMSVDDTGSIVVPPTTVGVSESFPSAASGYDLHGVPLGAPVEGEADVLYRELAHGSYPTQLLCYRLRTFAADGLEPHDIPFQLACMSAARVTRSARLLELPAGHAALVWAERPRVGAEGHDQITTDTPWDEGIYLTMITPSGRRGSEIVRVTSDESTVMGSALDRRTESTGPYPGDLTVAATSEGDHVYIAWRDERVDAPGIYLRSYTCSVDSTR